MSTTTPAADFGTAVFNATQIADDNNSQLLQMNAVDRCPSQLSAVYADGAS